MNARFRVSSTFAITGRSRFVLGGIIMDGVVRRGDYLCAPCNVGVPLASIEFLQTRGKRDDEALTFEYRSADELAFWRSIDWVGQELEVAASLEAAGPALKMSNDR